MPTLIIIDMQTKFDVASSSSTVKEIVRQVHLAKNREAPIVLVEYRGSGKTDPLIIEAIGSYRSFITILKGKNDGSDEVIEACTKCDISLKRVQVCGVYTSYCVRETVEGLLNKVPHCTVELIVRGCNCNQSDAINAPWTIRDRLLKIETEVNDERVHPRTGQLSSVHS